MSWSLDWFAAEKAAKSGAQIRRAGWTDRYIIYALQPGGGHVYMLVSGSTRRVVKATDFTLQEFKARDWTDEPYDSDRCAAVPVYNQTPVVYGNWTSEPIFTPPPPPGFLDPS